MFLRFFLFSEMQLLLDVWACARRRDAKMRIRKTDSACQPAAQLSVPLLLTLLSPNCHLGETTAAGLQVTHFSSRWRKNICFLAHKLSAVQTIPWAHCYPPAPPPPHLPPLLSILSAHCSFHYVPAKPRGASCTSSFLSACEFTSLQALWLRGGNMSRVIQAIRQAAHFQLCAIFRHNYQ